MAEILKLECEGWEEMQCQHCSRYSIEELRGTSCGKERVFIDWTNTQVLSCGMGFAVLVYLNVVTLQARRQGGVLTRLCMQTLSTSM